MESVSPKAVFLSYAREDTAAAQRIAEALRSHGVEVWFDQNELRGGDAWDAKIRQQIKECALFIPVISANTQGRGEGYFRLEWKLAAERTHLMAEGMPFLAPVAVDGTREFGAIVPAEFLCVQWTLLPGALPTLQFVEQVKRLLAAPSLPASAHKTGPKLAPPFPVAKPGSGLPVRILLALGALALGFGAYYFLRPAAREAPAAPPKAAVEPTPVPQTGGKSIAVLPFENMSEDKGNAYFCDGMQEDILTNLAKIRELRVVSRTSVEQYRGTTKSIRQIARELGVAWVLEGSVQRAGGKVRVTGQLINAANDEHMWADNFDRDITDIFAIQSELAKKIAGSLQAVLSPQEKILLERKPTENIGAYDLYLKARNMSNNSPSFPLTVAQELESLLKTAVELDPQFAAAWGELAAIEARFYFVGLDKTPARLAVAQAAVDRAVSLAPDTPEVIGSVGRFYYLTQRDYSRAVEQLEKLVRMQPNDGDAWEFLGVVQRSEGQWSDAIASGRKSVELDAASVLNARALTASLLYVRRFDEALALMRRVVSLVPESREELFVFARAELLATGAASEADGIFTLRSTKENNRDDLTHFHEFLAEYRGDLAEFIRLDRLQSHAGEFGYEALRNAWVYFVHGDVAVARTRLGKVPADLRARLVEEPNNYSLWWGLSQMELILGNNAEALRCALKATELPEAKDGFDGPPAWINLAIIHAWTGNKDRAIGEIADILRRPSYLNVHMLRGAPPYAPLRGDPRFEALMNDPKNNAPLF